MKNLYRVLLGGFLLVVAVALLSPLNSAVAQGNRVGEVILLQGQVLDTEGKTIPGAVVEIWQADSKGNYNHPNDASTSELLPDFQYFGTSTVGEDGYFTFRTIKPAPYESRPSHVHVRVKIDGQTALTTQFYFEEDSAMIASDGVAGGSARLLILATQDTTDVEGKALRIGTANLVIDRNGGTANVIEPTETQTEGPYYPVINFSGYDNNLISVASDDAVVMPMLILTPGATPAVQAFTLLNLNTATADQLLTIPNMSNRMVREFFEYRPYVNIQQFRREISKYVGDAQVQEYEKYVYVPIQVDQSNEATLKQIPGVDDTIAQALINARPYGSNEAFLNKLGEWLNSEQVTYAQNFLEVK